MNNTAILDFYFLRMKNFQMSCDKTSVLQILPVQPLKCCLEHVGSLWEMEAQEIVSLNYFLTSHVLLIIVVWGHPSDIRNKEEGTKGDLCVSSKFLGCQTWASVFLLPFC